MAGSAIINHNYWRYATMVKEDIKGSSTPGKVADLDVLSADPLVIPIEDVPDIQVLMTMIGGKAEYCRENAPCPASVEKTGKTDTGNEELITASASTVEDLPERAFDGDPETIPIPGMVPNNGSRLIWKPAGGVRDSVDNLAIPSRGDH